MWQPAKASKPAKDRRGAKALWGHGRIRGGHRKASLPALTALSRNERHLSCLFRAGAKPACSASGESDGGVPNPPQRSFERAILSSAEPAPAQAAPVRPQPRLAARASSSAGTSAACRIRRPAADPLVGGGLGVCAEPVAGGGGDGNGDGGGAGNGDGGGGAIGHALKLSPAFRAFCVCQKFVDSLVRDCRAAQRAKLKLIRYLRKGGRTEPQAVRNPLLMSSLMLSLPKGESAFASCEL